MEELKILKNAIHCMKVGADMAVCEDCNLYECDHSDVKDMAMIAIQALEKQIPKKVVCDGDDESDYVRCPCCDEILGLNDSIYDDFYYRNWKPMHCIECGQTMIWKQRLSI